MIYDGGPRVLRTGYRGVYSDHGRMALENEHAFVNADGCSDEGQRGEAWELVNRGRNRGWVRRRPAIEHEGGDIDPVAKTRGIRIDEDDDIHTASQTLGHAGRNHAREENSQDRGGGDTRKHPNPVKKLPESRSFGNYAHSHRGFQVSRSRASQILPHPDARPPRYQTVRIPSGSTPLTAYRTMRR